MKKALVKTESDSFSEGLNLRFLVGWRGLCPGLTAAVISGLLLSFAFSPLEWWRAAWIGLLPLMAVPVPRRLSRRLVIGYLFGLVHFVISLHWLNEVGFFAGYLLACFCALFFLVWYLGFSHFVLFLCGPVCVSSNTLKMGAKGLAGLPAGRFTAAGIFAALLWVSLEWVRSWLFTGFPWNQLGLSQWQNIGLLQVTTFTGVYGLSFLLLTANMAILWVFLSFWRRCCQGGRFEFPWPVFSALVLFLPVLPLAAAVRRADFMPTPDVRIRIAAVQGNIPQMRVWTQDQLGKALDVYDQLSREAAEANPDLIVWPETAVPAPAFFSYRYQTMLAQLLSDIKTPLLFGNIHSLPADGFENDRENGYNDFNSVFFLNQDGEINDYYFKVKLVPFGEYVPMGDVFPFLHDLIGMGRDLQAGRELTLFELKDNVWAGVNICFEDVFAEVSRKFAIRGANLLMTLTNDAWFAETSGSRQHMLHAVLRAVENRRPLLRSGNNSDTCLILPDGEVRNLLYDHETGNRFIRAWHIYSVPIWFDPGITFYTRYGDIFAYLCVFMTLLCMLYSGVDELRRRRQALLLVASGCKNQH